MRRRTARFTALFLVGLAVFAGYAAWAARANARLGFGWDGLAAAWPYLVAGALTVGLVIAAFVWLAFFSERRGFDDGASSHEP